MYIKSLLAVSAFALFLNGCNSDDIPFDTPNVTFTDTTAISVIAISGGMIDLTGLYTTSCYVTGGGSVKEDLVISGNTWNYTQTSYTDNACSTGASVSALAASMVASGTTIAISGWVDGSGSNTVAPTSADGSGLLSDNESVTPITLTITAATGDFSSIPTPVDNPIFYVVDDSDVNIILYRDKDYANGLDTASTVDAFVKQ